MKKPETDFITALNNCRKILSLPRSTASTSVANKAKKVLEAAYFGNFAVYEDSKEDAWHTHGARVWWDCGPTVDREKPMRDNREYRHAKGLSETEASIRLFNRLYKETDRVKNACFMNPIKSSDIHPNFRCIIVGSQGKRNRRKREAQSSDETRVFDCPRCEGEHETRIYKLQKDGKKNFSHWGRCPETNEPILFKPTIPYEPL